MDLANHKGRVREQFGRAAADYVESPTHAGGDDLAQLVAWAEGGPEKVALDVATGGGHTALALAGVYGRVVATDLTEEMLEAAREHARSRGAGNVEFRVADAEALPFDDESFDAVSCRIAPHHFDDVPRFVAEAARVLRPGGLFLLEDNSAPEDPELARFLNLVERVRDATHNRSLPASEWCRVIGEAGLEVEEERLFPKTHGLEQWLSRSHASAEARRRVERLFLEATPRAREALRIQVSSEGRVLSYADEKVVIRARKPARSA